MTRKAEQAQSALDAAYGDEGYRRTTTQRYVLRVEYVRPVPEIVLPEPASAETKVVSGTKKTAEGARK